MNLIKFESIEKHTGTKYKTTILKNQIGDVTFTKEVKTGIPDSVYTEYKTYYIPANKIEQLVSFKGIYKINNILVSEKTFQEVIKKLTNLKD